MKHLVIVESPAKAKTIEKYLGKDYTVLSSYGHIRDLPKSGMNIDVENNFTPHYAINDDKKKTVRELKKAAKEAETVWLATDEDREGEAIAWHLSEALKLKETNTKRIVFHEITKPAILAAIENPRTIDKDLVDAQQARRIVDRLVGYELSPVLWKKVRTGLSAGRVQSVAVRLIVEREQERDAFVPESSFRITAELLVDGAIIKAELPKKLATEAEAKAFLESLGAATITISDLSSNPTKRAPSAPFTTSTLQQQAYRRFGFSVRQTMTLAQRLYEAGLITYMRTDSVNLSEVALQEAKQVITSEFGTKYSTTRRYKTKKKDAQEAHEAIRPTSFARISAGADDQQKRLYDLIYKQALASQMTDAEIERTTATITLNNNSEVLTAKGEVITFDGFLVLYNSSSDGATQEAKHLPPLVIGQELTLQQANAKETFTRPSARYTEATLVKALEELGIGRPSTYAPTIGTIQAREYVEKGSDEGIERTYTLLTLQDDNITITKQTEMTDSNKGKLVPTDIGTLVTGFLIKYFPAIVDYQFTATIEEQFDEIAAGSLSWTQIVSEFYNPFHTTIEASKDITREESMHIRELGLHPDTGKPVFVRMARFGPVVQMGHKDDDEKPQFASLKKGQKMDDITMEDAIELLTLPRLVGTTEDGEEIYANFGRFGPYIKFGSLYQSITPDDPFTITLERARELVAEKKEKEANKYVKVFEDSDIQILNGRWGPYIKIGKKNVKIPKTVEDASKLTIAECEKIIAEYKPGRRPPRKK